MISRLINLVLRIEDALLAVLLTAMIGIAAGQVLLRNLLDDGFFWGDSAVRVAVLWIAMLGAMVASRRDEHIRIDIAGRYLPETLKKYVDRLVCLATCVLLMIFTWHSIDFVRYEYEDGTLAFAFVPAWLCEVIIPVGAGVMSLRYGLLAVRRRQPT